MVTRSRSILTRGTQSPDRKNQPTLPSVITVSLLPFRTLDTSPAPSSVLASFTRDFFSIPLLPNRLPANALAILARALPFDRLITYIDSSGHASTVDLADAIPLLANVLAFGKDRVAHFGNKEVLVAYLNVLRTLLDRLPLNVFADGSKGKERGVDEDGDVSMVEDDAGPSEPPVDAMCLSTLSALPSPSHTSALLAASTRFSASSRPAFAGLFVSLLQTWPSKRDEFVGALVYGRGSDQGSGLLREIWRGWLRSGRLGKALGGQREGSSRVLNALQGNPCVYFFSGF
jgi:ubiquitin-protein ligase E3 C